MFGVPDYGAFVAAVILFLCVPGPGNLALITATGQGGRRAGMAAGIGLICGDQVLMWTAVAGLAAVLRASPTLFHGVQWLGAAYLAWMGWRMLRTQAGSGPVLTMQPHHYFRQALIITLLNPKAIVFYMAFFPLFVDPAQHPTGLTFAFMAVTIATLTGAYCTVIVLLTHQLAGRLNRHTRIGVWLQRLAGITLLGFSVRLALAR